MEKGLKKKEKDSMSDAEEGILENLLESFKPMLDKFMKPMKKGIADLLGNDERWLILRREDDCLFIIIIDHKQGIKQFDVDENYMLMIDTEDATLTPDYIDLITEEVSLKFGINIKGK